jgi:hypothetical protein
MVHSDQRYSLRLNKKTDVNNKMSYLAQSMSVDKQTDLMDKLELVEQKLTQHLKMR